MKRLILSLAMAFTLCLALSPAAAAEESVKYLTWDNNSKKLIEATRDSPTEATAGNTAWGTSGTETWYVANNSVNISSRVTVTGDVHLILTDGCHLNAKQGIEVQGNNSLTIYAQSEGADVGALTAISNSQPAIGSNNSNGAITINGGNINATGAGNSAAIGGGRRSENLLTPGTITINGGRVIAMGNNGNPVYQSDGGAGIGGSSYGHSGEICIRGGYVEAYGCNGAGIGGGYSGNSGAITITGGTVIAKASGNGSGIGGGESSHADSITISGDNTVVIASSDGWGAPLGADNHDITRDGGLIVEGKAGKLYSNSVTLSDSITIPEGATVTVGQNQTLTVPSDVELTLAGKIEGTENVNIENGSTVKVQVTYDRNKTPETPGDKITQTYTYGESYGAFPDASTWVGHKFLGWFTEETGGTQVTSSDTVTSLAGQTLYARWQEKRAQITVTLSSTAVTYGEPLTITATATAEDAPTPPDSSEAAENEAQLFINGSSIVPSDFTVKDGIATATLLTLTGESDWETYKGKFHPGSNEIKVEFGTITELDLLGSTGTADLTVNNRTRTIPQPTAQEVTSATVTLETVAASPSMQYDQILYGYSITEGETPGNWQWSTDFTDLLPDTTYYFYAKVNANNGAFYAEAISPPVEVHTAKALDTLPERGLCLNTGDITVRCGTGETLLVTQDEAVYSISKDEPILVTGADEMTSHTITVIGAKARIILANVKQGGGEGGYSSPITIESSYDSSTGTSTPSNVTLALEGNNVLAGAGFFEQGIAVLGGSTLTVGGSGSLKIGNEQTRVGVGIGHWEDVGNVVINGGTLNITAQNVGIGAEMLMPHGGNTPSITINGGVVKTNVSNGYGVGIGTRHTPEDGMEITVTGGSVELSGEGNKISAAGIYENTGSVTITGGSISGVPEDEDTGITPAPVNESGKPLIPVVVSTGKNGKPVDALGITGMEYGSPAKTDGSGNLTLYLPPLTEGGTQYTGTVIIDGDVQEITANADTGKGSTESTGIHVETPENEKPEIKPDGSITLPGGSKVTKPDGETVQVPEGGGAVTPSGEVKKLFTVTFDYQDGGTETSQTVIEGGKAVKPADSQRDGYDFGGWYTDAACTSRWNFENTVTHNITLYAKWTVKSGGGGGGIYIPPVYPPTAEVPGGGGTVTVSPGRPGAGDKVTVKPKPDTGYEVDKVTVTDRNGNPVPVKQNPDGTYTFTQPSGKVNIEVSYKPEEAPWEDPYTDVSETAWYFDAVRYVSVHGLMEGYGGGRFGTDDDLSRAQLAQILYNHAGRPDPSGESSFPDVTGGAWYADAVAWAAESGIVGGYGGGQFGPDDSITREQLAVMMYRYAGSPAPPNLILDFTDAGEASGYALDALRWAVANGIINGAGGRKLDPGGPATRAQTAAVLMRYLEGTQE